MGFRSLSLPKLPDPTLRKRGSARPGAQISGRAQTIAVFRGSAYPALRVDEGGNTFVDGAAFLREEIVIFGVRIINADLTVIAGERQDEVVPGGV